MKRKYFCFVTQLLIIFSLCVVHVNAQDSDADLSIILQAVQKNIDSQKERVVNILSKEEITIEEFDDKEELVKMSNIISNYRIFFEPTSTASDCRILFSEMLELARPSGMLREEREILSTEKNGNIEKKDSSREFLAKGNTYVDLFNVFDRQNEKCFDYKLTDKQKISLMGTGRIKERDVYAIEIKQKETDIGQADNWFWVIKYRGVAMVDARTMEIVQLSRSVNYSIVYKKFSTDWRGRVVALDDEVEKYTYCTQYEFDRMKIGDHFLTLPLVKSVKFFRENGQLTTAYTYRYSDHRAFNVGVKLHFVQDEELLDQMEIK